MTFVLTTTLDIWTTWVAIYQFGYYELIPFTDTSSIQAMAIPEVITLFIEDDELCIDFQKFPTQSAQMSPLVLD